MEPKEYDFEFPRGDTCPLKFQLVDANKDIIKLQDVDEVFFTVKKGYSANECILQKRFSTGDIVQEESYLSLVLLPEDTERLNYGTYVYDVCVKSGDLTKTLCIGQITLTNEVTFVSNE